MQVPCIHPNLGKGCVKCIGFIKVVLNRSVMHESTHVASNIVKMVE